MTLLDPDDFTVAATTDLLLPTKRARDIFRQLIPAFSRRQTIPVLNTVLIDAGLDGTTFCVTNLDMQITVTADDLATATPFRACVPFGLLMNIAASANTALRVTHLAGDTKGLMPRLCLATDDGFSATINLICAPDDFPAFPAQFADHADWRHAPMQPADLLRHLALCQHCISREETRYYLNGVYLHRKPYAETLRSVATDGHRLAVIDGSTPWPDVAGTIWPRNLINTLLSVLDARSNEPLHIAVMADQPRATITTGPVRIEAKLIEGTFPDYTRVIPTADTVLTATLNATGLRRLLPLASHRSTAVTLMAGRAAIVSPEMGEVSITVQMSGGDWVDQHTYNDKTVTEKHGYNLQYLLDQARITPEFRLETNRAAAPAKIYSTDPDAMWVLMPMCM